MGRVKVRTYMVLVGLMMVVVGGILATDDNLSRDDGKGILSIVVTGLVLFVVGVILTIATRNDFKVKQGVPVSINNIEVRKVRDYPVGYRKLVVYPASGNEWYEVRVKDKWIVVRESGFLDSFGL